MAFETNFLKDYFGTLPQKTDVDSIMAKDANGNPVWIKKADLAAVAAELMKPVLYKGYINATDENLKNAVNGIFSLSQPSGGTGPNDHGLLISFYTNASTSTIQLMFSIRGKIYSRYKSSSGAWSEWSVYTGINYNP